MPVRLTLADQISKEILFFNIFMIVIFSWVLVSLWGKWLDNFTFVTLGLDEKSSTHTFIIALTVTLIVIACIVFLRTFGINYSKIVVGDCDEYGALTNNLDGILDKNNVKFFGESYMHNIYEIADYD
jgi:hypothetical protein